MKPWLQKKDRSVYHKLIAETRVDDGSVFYDFHRMNRQNFDVLLNLVAPLIQKETTQLRDTISAPERLSLTLRYLATGETRRSLGFQYRISHSLITYIIPEVCSAIYSVLKDMYLKLPSTSEEWKQVASDFYNSWNFPMCIGALDGKRFFMRKPENTGSEYYDYKSRHSMIMLALVDAHYKFMYVDVGAQGCSSDAGVWDRCKLREYLEKEKLLVPPPDTLPFSDQKVPYVIVGDDAFPLKNYLMKPYPGQNLSVEQRIYNYRLSRARRISENAFGILVAKFRVFEKPIHSSPANTRKIIFATVVLHNFLRNNSRQLENENIGNGLENHGLQSLDNVGRRPAKNALATRDIFKDYFNGRGRVRWQEDAALLN
ncbi:protein ALP1-like [Penaeus monodon]|uniref:protein ALP1-like n=1 Tax=Penaeus monodon TaxID=6687 RepID=UPI0018A7357D|nr:protein ALP1-like [Penaeus monodon]